MTDAVVIGGGFAGAAAACRLAGDGHRILWVESTPRLGGRAGSAIDPATGETIDLGHHVLMRCCTASVGFLLRLGLPDAIRFQPALSVPIVAPETRSVLRSSPLPGPLHLLPSLLRYRLLPFADRLRVAAAGCALLHTRRSEDEAFADWLTRQRQTETALRRLWDPMCIAALNARSDEVGVDVARKLFRDAFFRPGGADLGGFTVPLAAVFDAARRYVERRNGVVRTSTAATGVHIERGRVRGADLATGERVGCATIVSAVPPAALTRLCSDPALDALHTAAARLRWAPIINLHAWFDRSVLDVDLLVAVDSPVQAVFDVTRLHATKRDGPFHVVFSQSAAEPWIDRPFDEVRRCLVGGLEAVSAAARSATVHHTLVVRHRQATFVPAPGVDRLRPAARTAIPGLYLAGDWTSTGWPSTIEGAIRSGIVAAAHAELQELSGSE